MSRWNRIGKGSNDKRETHVGGLDLRTWLWLREAIDDVFRYDPIDNVELFIRDDNEMIQCMDIELMDNHHNDGGITREVILRPNKKCAKVKYVG